MHKSAALCGLEAVLQLKLPVPFLHAWQQEDLALRWLRPHAVVERTLQMRECGVYFGRKWPLNAVIVAEQNNGDLEIVRGGTEDNFSLLFRHDYNHALNAYGAEKLSLLRKRVTVAQSLEID